MDKILEKSNFIGELPTPSKMGPNSKSKFAYPSPCANGYTDHVAGNFDSSNFFNPELINAKFGDMGKIYELLIP